jgi:hypothetical protein
MGQKGMLRLLMARGVSPSDRRRPRRRRTHALRGAACAAAFTLAADNAIAAVPIEWAETRDPPSVESGLLFAQAGSADKRAISIASIIVGEPAGETPFSMQVVGTEALPTGSYIRIRGLPPLASMSEGFAIAPSLWAVPITSLSKLRIKLPPTTKGPIALNVALVTVEGNVLVETKTTVSVGSRSPPATLQPGPAPTAKAKQAPGPQSALPPVKLEQQAPGALASAILPDAPSEPAPLPPDPQQAAEEQPLTPQQVRALGFISRGQELFGEGNVSSARLLFKRAADAGLAYGALFLGQTYDPNELALYQVRGLGGDPAQAKVWYEKAYVLGAPEADELLRRLGPR